MSFLDELQGSTKTKAQLQEEARLKKQHAFEYQVRYFVDQIKSRCRYAAEHGQHSVFVTREWDDHPVRFPKEEAYRYAGEVESLLREEGLTDITCRIRRAGSILQNSYSVSFNIQW